MIKRTDANFNLKTLRSRTWYSFDNEGHNFLRLPNQKAGSRYESDHTGSGSDN